MAKKIKCIVKRPDEQFGHVTWISDSLKNLSNTVGGYIETVTLDNGVVLICNEEGSCRGSSVSDDFRHRHRVRSRGRPAHRCTD